MHAQDAYKIVSSAYNSSNSGRFFSLVENLALGKGQIFSDVPYPLFDPETSTYMTVSGMVLVLTHECDIDPTNASKVMSEDVLILPVIPLEAIVESQAEVLDEAQLRSFLTNLGARNVSRLMYIPPLTNHFDLGAALYFNQITNCHISALNDKTPITSLTGHSLYELEIFLENHLLRPKDDRLAYVPEENAGCKI